jgi:hypothetical protein
MCGIRRKHGDFEQLIIINFKESPTAIEFLFQPNQNLGLASKAQPGLS